MNTLSKPVKPLPLAISELYRGSSMGRTLIDAVDELVIAGKIPPALAAKVLQHFDEQMAKVLREQVGSHVNLKGTMKRFNNISDVWLWNVEDALISVDRQKPMRVDRLKIVAMASKVVGRPASPENDSEKNPRAIDPFFRKRRIKKNGVEWKKAQKKLVKKEELEKNSKLEAGMELEL
ncbi:transcription initiation factor IIA, gamma subunit, helical domain-containing protein [Sphaerosporella brunnea]|uniref:Transcription initiation factor IIA subunit 2 n=1 Tax=Sphaerosporella brunnea TaxID=1250544 RepID=A0A5J5F954_9PEZI|nr:transcription initiation factor IIA, gamma subunit, helical domain-containing protein [Sphaerosporella brunnea]